MVQETPFSPVQSVHCELVHPLPEVYSDTEKKLDSHDFKISLVNSFNWKKPQKLPNPTHPEEENPQVRKLLVSWNATFQRTFLQSQVLKDKGHVETAMHVITRKVQEKDSRENRLPSGAQTVKLVALCVLDCFRVYHSVQNFRAVLLPGAGNGLSSDSDSD